MAIGSEAFLIFLMISVVLFKLDLKNRVGIINLDRAQDILFSVLGKLTY